MTTVFQPNLFQHSGTAGLRLFQVDEGATVTPHPVGGSTGQGGKHKRPHRRILVEIDGESFPVNTPDEARELLTQARELAVAQAEELAEAALVKSAKAKRPAAKAAALDIVVPRVSLTIDPMDEYAQQIRAQVDAANAALAQIYEQAMVAANRAAVMRAEQDEEDVIALLMLHL